MVTGLKFKKTETSSHFYAGASYANCTSWRSLHWTACLPRISAIGASHIKEFLECYCNWSDWGFSIQSVQWSSKQVEPFWPIRIVPLDLSNCEDYESLFAWGWTSQRPGVGNSVYVWQLLSGSESILFLFTEDWGLAKLKHQQNRDFCWWCIGTNDLQLTLSFLSGT